VVFFSADAEAMVQATASCYCYWEVHGERLIEWNFVSYSRERIAQAEDI